MMTQFDAQKEFQLPPSFYLESKSLETDFDNVAEIGSGAFGSVVLGTFKGRVVAVKLMVNSNLEEKNQRRVLLKEAKTMVNLRSHGGLPTLVGICVDESPFKLVMDFCSFEGSADSLYSCLKARFAISIEKMHVIYLSLAEAVVTCSGYLHNDIKLDNVVLSYDTGIN